MTGAPASTRIAPTQIDMREKYAKVGRPASRKSDLIRRAAEDGLLE